MNPQIASQYVNIPLTNYSIEKAPAGFIADALAPVLPVKFDTGIYYEYGQEDFDVSDNDVRAPGTEASIEGYSLIKHTYGPLEDHARKIKVPIEQQRNQMAPLDALQDATRKLVTRAKMYKEVDLFNQISNTAVITQNSTPTFKWDDFDNSDIANDFSAAFDQIMAGIQKDRSELSVVISYPAWTKMRHHPQIIEFFKYGNNGAPIITADMFREFLGVKEVLFANTVKNTSQEGATPVTNSYIFGKNAWVIYRDPTPSLYTVSGLYTLNLPGMNQGGQSAGVPGVNGAGPWTIYHYWSQKQKSDYVEISYYYQQFVMAPQAIYYFQNVVS
jgi:hypothetical protein